MSEENTVEDGASQNVEAPKDEYTALKNIVTFEENFISLFLSEKIREALSTTHYNYVNKSGILYSIINGDTFLPVYEALPCHRMSLINIPIAGCRGVLNYSDFYFSKERSKEIIEDIIENHKNKIDRISLLTRARIINGVSSDIVSISLPEEIERLKAIDVDLGILNEYISEILKQDRTKHSLEYYESLYNSLSRSDGATDTKALILKRAFDSEHIPIDLINKIAISSPQSLKQTVLENLTPIMHMICNSIFVESLSDADFEKVNNTHYKWNTDIPFPSSSWYKRGTPKDELEAKRADIEKLLKKFINVKTSYCLRLLCETLSLESLAWLMPNLKNHKELQDFVNYRIDKEISSQCYDIYYNNNSRYKRRSY